MPQRDSVRQRRQHALFNNVVISLIVISLCVRTSPLARLAATSALWRKLPIRIYNVHCMNPLNAGDMCSAPMQYWDGLCRRMILSAVPARGQMVHINALGKEPFQSQQAVPWIPQGSPVIVGGGGLLSHANFEEPMLTIAQRCEEQGPLVFWGVGLNSYSRGDIVAASPVLPHYLTEVAKRSNVLVGCRDFDPSSQFRWVPCVSCLHESLDPPRVSRQFFFGTLPAYDDGAGCAERIGMLTSTVPEGNHVAAHLDDWVKRSLLNATDVLSNAGTDMSPIVEFLRRYDVIVTSSYHAAYWSTLLGKKVIVVNVWSSKFSWMKHPPTVYSGDLLADVVRAKRFPNALEECREATYGFARDVFALLGRRSTGQPR